MYNQHHLQQLQQLQQFSRRPADCLRSCSKLPRNLLSGTDVGTKSASDQAKRAARYAASETFVHRQTRVSASASEAAWTNIGGIAVWMSSVPVN